MLSPFRKVTMIDIAHEAGVSKSTVSLVLQNSELVKEETRDRVLAAMDRLGYVYNRGAANLRRKTSEVLGMVINDLTNPFFAEIAVGIEQALQTAGFIPLLANTGEDPRRQAQVMQAMREHGAAGFLFSPAIGTDEAFARDIMSWRLPIVTVMRRIPGVAFRSVAPDNVGGARLATEHLIGLGHQRIAFLGGRPGMVVMEDRCQGYRMALATAGLPADPGLIVEERPNRDGGLAGVGAVLSMPDPPTAVLCFNDAVAFGALHGLWERGLQAGRDLAVVGFDDIANAAHTTPPLTTVAVSCRTLGERAAHLLLSELRGEPTEDHIGEVRLVVRASSGPAVCG